MALKYHAAGLPPGLRCDPDTGEVTGTPAVGLTTIDAPEKDYTVEISAVDESGLGATRSFTWTIKHTVEILFTAGDVTAFDPVITLAPGATFVPQWEFGDGNSEESATPSHTYASTGTYHGRVRVSSAETVGIDFGGKGLTALDVTALTTLESLKCEDNAIEELDVEELVNLTTLWCENNALASLDVTALVLLQDLRCGNNSLDVLDVGGLTALTDLRCESNLLGELDVMALTSLTHLDAGDNAIADLDVSAATNMVTLDCSNNGISTLDVSGMASLVTLRCEHNNISALTFHAAATALDEVLCHFNVLNQASLDGMSAHLVAAGGTSARTFNCSKQSPQVFLDDDDYTTLLTNNWTITADLIPDMTVHEGDDAGVDFTLDCSEFLVGATAFGATNLPAGLSINPATGVIEGYVDGDVAGSYSVDVTGTGGTPSAETFIMTVEETALLSDRSGNLLVQRDGKVIALRA